MLVITAYPDERDSTRDLFALVDDVNRRDRVTVHVWFLRCTDYQKPWPGSPVVDHLRTWWPAAALSAIGAERAAGMLRGLRLRWWLRRIDPDAVVFDDGVGERLIEHAPRTPFRVVRLNAELPMGRAMEPALDDRPVDLLFVHPACQEAEPPARLRRVVGPYLGHRPEVIALGEDEARRRTRRELDLPNEPLVVGWGADGWLDGPDVFIRVLWALRRRGVAAHGVWFGLGDDVHELDRLVSEADRCGLADQMHFRPQISIAARLCGDAVLNCDRSPGRAPEEIVEALVSGCPVVAFPMVGVVDEGIEVVAMLDVEAAAAALASHLTVEGLAERPARRHEARVRLDICGSFELMYSTGKAGG